MLSSILNSETAIEVNISIIRVFTKLRSFTLTQKDILIQLVKLEKEVKGNSSDIENIFLVLKKLIEKDILFKFHPKWIAKKTDYLLALTSKGRHLGRKIYGPDFNYFIDLKKVNYQLFDHSMSCQIVYNSLVREYMKQDIIDTNYIFNSILNEKEYRRKYGITSKMKQPDFVYISPTGLVVSIEVEITEKSNKNKFESYFRI